MLITYSEGHQVNLLGSNRQTVFGIDVFRDQASIDIFKTLTLVKVTGRTHTGSSKYTLMWRVLLDE